MTHAQSTIIIGVDYSEYCIPAVDEALRLSRAVAARGADAVLVPLLALPDEPATRLRGEAREPRERAEHSKQNLLQLIEARASQLGLALPRVEPCVRFGAAAASLLQEARGRRAELIAVGTHGRRGLSHLILGSVAEEVMRSAPCSVLVARPVEPLVLRGDQQLPLEIGTIEGTEDEIDQLPEADPAGVRLLSEPHVESARVVLYVLDGATGQTFVCRFDDAETVRVEPLEREWVPQPSPAARARATRAALDEARRSPERFAALLAEAARDQSRG